VYTEILLKLKLLKGNFYHCKVVKLLQLANLTCIVCKEIVI